MNLETTIATGITVAVIVLVTLVAGRLIGKRAPEQLREFINQLVPVLILATVVVGVLVILDPDQTDKLLSSTIDFVPKVLVAVLVIMIARTAGKIVGLLVETGMRRI